MNRRTLLTRALALAGAAAVAPLARPAEAATDDIIEFNEPLVAPTTYAELAARFQARQSETEEGPALIQWVDVHVPEPWQMTLHRTDGTRSVIDIETGAEVSFRHGILTFEAMQADCRALGCWFQQGADGWSFCHSPTPPRIENGWTIHDVLSQVYIGSAPLQNIGTVDAWRTSLHEEG